MKDLTFGAAAKKPDLSLLCRRKSEAVTDTFAKTEPRHASQKGHELHNSMQSCGGGGWGTWGSQLHTELLMRATQSRYIALCLMKEQKKPVKKWHFISTHKYTHTQWRKGRPSPCFSPFAYFPISHNTNQTAKLTSPPNKSAILRLYRRAPWQHQLNEAFGTPSPVLHADPQTAVPPLSEAAPVPTARLLKLRIASKHTKRTGLNITNTSAGLGSQKGSPQPNRPTDFIQCNQNLQSPKIIRDFQRWGVDTKYVTCYEIGSVKLYRN